MSGEFEAGDLILVKEINEEELKKGDIITYKISEKTLVTHRIIEIENDYGYTEYTTKGDANNVKDQEKVEFKNIEGKYLYKFSTIGKEIITLIQKPIGIIVAISIPIILMSFSILKKQKKNQKRLMRKEKRLKYEIEKNNRIIVNE